MRVEQFRDMLPTLPVPPYVLEKFCRAFARCTHVRGHYGRQLAAVHMPETAYLRMLRLHPVASSVANRVSGMTELMRQRPAFNFIWIGEILVGDETMFQNLVSGFCDECYRLYSANQCRKIFRKETPLRGNDTVKLAG